ncbi:hypothetical protein CHS0354_029453 [Potamilus streckersoni]|uniref:Netrin receptor UNC5 n=1 Tax=Potamilus streckersoni TaxID=2493646 RepID=A0AAE0W2B7_9BIVA|nr:hypothetical protein CHS0354_029453 [Potamilus streckersoni]
MIDHKLDDAIIGFSVAIVITALIGVLGFFFLLLKIRQLEKQLYLTSNGDEGPPVKRRQANFGNEAPITDSAICLSEIDAERPRHSSALDETIKPRFTIRMRKEEANVFGYTPLVSQMVAVAQDYYMDATMSEDVFPLAKMSIIQRDGSLLTFSGVLDTFGRPTSVTLEKGDNSEEVVLSEQKGLFVHKRMDSRGGSLELSGVSLEVPPGALLDPTLVSLGIVWNENYQPNLSKNEALLSPVVVCKPHGLKLKKSAKLTFPHCAVDISSTWNPRVLKRESTTKDSNEWKNISLDDYEERQVATDKMTLLVKKFMFFTCVGESRAGKVASKAVKFVAFSPGLQRGRIFKCRVYCINDYIEFQNLKSFEREEMQSQVSDSPVPLFVQNNERNICVELAHLSHGWDCESGEAEEIQLDSVWHGLTPHCSFVFKHGNGIAPKEIICEFQSFQRGRSDRRAKLKIAEMQSLTNTPLSEVDGSAETEITRRLVLLLDPKIDTGICSDWRGLAEKMGYDQAEINWLNTQGSPTTILIEKWIEKNKSFHELQTVMEEIDRQDAVQEIREVLGSSKYGYYDNSPAHQ